jgi:prepilin-type N-terminal cleavage/methylation domain-containing protein
MRSRILRMAPRSRSLQAGMTLIELLVVVSLASLVVYGAVQIHSSISSQLDRQSRVSDAQQTLRASMEVIERYVRLAGRYLGNNGGLITVKPVGQAFEQDQAVLDWTDGLAANADRISIFLATDVAVPITPGAYSSSQTVTTGDVSQFRDKDLFIIDYYDTSVAPPVHKLCLKQVTGAPAAGKLQHTTSSNLNPSAGNDLCASKLTATTQPAYARLMGRSGGVSFRINTTDDPLVPYLEMDPDGPLIDTTMGGSGFQRLAPNVEDLQFAFQLAKTATDQYPDLTAPFEGWVNAGPLTAAQLARVRNVRITLIVRVPQQEEGMFFNNAGISQGKGERPAVENRVASTAGGVPDGYVRRRLESIVQVRNLGFAP